MTPAAPYSTGLQKCARDLPTTFYMVSLSPAAELGKDYIPYLKDGSSNDFKRSSECLDGNAAGNVTDSDPNLPGPSSAGRALSPPPCMGKFDERGLQQHDTNYTAIQ